jgi:hypothetical protein
VFDPGALQAIARAYGLLSRSGSEISVVMDGVNAPPNGATVLVKGRFHCWERLSSVGTRLVKSLLEIDRRVDIPPGSVTLE